MFVNYWLNILKLIDEIYYIDRLKSYVSILIRWDEIFDKNLIDLWLNILRN